MSLADEVYDAILGDDEADEEEEDEEEEEDTFVDKASTNVEVLVQK